MNKLLFAFPSNDRHDTMMGVKIFMKDDPQDTQKWGQKPSHLGNFIKGRDKLTRHSVAHWE